MRIAVVGAGIAGLVASHVLSRRHQVTLFEAEATAGGHANTVAISDNGRQRPVDTGFIVFNRENYPLLSRFFEYLNVPNHQSDMSFSVSCEKTNFEYSGTSMNGFFSQRQNIMNPKHWMLLADILRFNSQAEHWFRERADPQLTVAQFIRECPVGKSFAEYYLLPLGSSLWSCHPRRFERFPMKFVIEFLKNHAMLQVRHRPQWLTVAGGSRCYVNAVTSQLPAGLLRLQKRVDRVVPRKGGVDVFWNGSNSAAFDEAVLATHADTSLDLVDKADEEENEALGSFPYQDNQVCLHTDTKVLPRNRRAWSSWNYRISNHSNKATSITYNMNMLQGIESDKTFCVSLNQLHALDPQKVRYRTTYRHPVFQPGRDHIQSQHSKFVRRRGVSYCGAYWGYGFHEDGVRSALSVCQAFDVDPEF